MKSSAFPGTSFFRNNWGTATPRNGDYAYAISNHAYGYLQSPLINVGANKQYSLYTFMRGELDPDDSNGNVYVRVWFYNSSGGTISSIDVDSASPGSLTTSWVQKGGPFTTPAGTAKIRILLFSYMNSGWVAFDDVSLLDGTTEMLDAATKGFESSGIWQEVKSSAFPGTSIYRSNWGTTIPHNGTYAYAISNQVHGYVESPPIAVQPNTDYDLNAWVRGELDAEDSFGSWKLRVVFYDSAGGINGMSVVDVDGGAAGSLNTTWGQHGGRFTTPDGASYVRLRLFSYLNTGWVAFDDVSLVAAPGVKTTTYFYAGAQRVAMRRSDGVSTKVYYMIGDHLGSSSLLVDSSGAKVGEMLYKPWGELRYASGDLPTEYRFTGQRRESSLGLYDYGARWYDPALGRFAQADSIVPLAQQGSQAWDRFAYVNNNPLRYIDPSGHMLVEDGSQSSSPYVTTEYSDGSKRMCSSSGCKIIPQSPEDKLREKIDRSFDPYLGGYKGNKDEYEESEQQRRDAEAADVYARHGYDLDQLAKPAVDNPLTEDDFLDDTEQSNPEWVFLRARGNATSDGYVYLIKELGLDTTNMMNYEPNYLDALMTNNGEAVEKAKTEWFNDLLELFDDPEIAIDYIDGKWGGPTGQ